MRLHTHLEEAGTRILFFSAVKDVRAIEAEGRMRDEWGACHNILSWYELRGRRGTSVGGGVW